MALPLMVPVAVMTVLPLFPMSLGVAAAVAPTFFRTCVWFQHDVCNTCRVAELRAEIYLNIRYNDCGRGNLPNLSLPDCRMHGRDSLDGVRRADRRGRGDDDCYDPCDGHCSCVFAVPTVVLFQADESCFLFRS
jgi:hypothetical protein